MKINNPRRSQKSSVLAENVPKQAVTQWIALLSWGLATPRRSNPFLFARTNSAHHVLFEQSRKISSGSR
jgi:hypothetical protein